MLFMLSGTLFARSYTPWVEKLGKNQLAINPFVSAPTDSLKAATVDPWIIYGVSDKSDFFLNPGNFMTRYEIFNNGLLAFGAGSNGLIPGFHYIYSSGNFNLETNVSATFTPGSDDAAFGAIIAPVYDFSKGVGIYAELQPTIVEGDLTMAYLPGVHYAWGDSELSVGIGLDEDFENPSVNFWYWRAFNFSSN